MPQKRASRITPTVTELSNEEIERMFSVGDIDKEQITEWLKGAFNLTRLMTLAGFTGNEICDRLGIFTSRIGEKEMLLYKALRSGKVNTSMSFQTIADVMKDEKDISRQSWGQAWKALVERRAIQ